MRELLTIASFLLFGHSDREDAHQVRAALRPSTLRRQFQVVDAMTDCRLRSLSSPHLQVLAGLLKPEPEEAEEGNTPTRGRNETKKPVFSLSDARKPPWHKGDIDVVEDGKPLAEYSEVTQKLFDLQIDATWASIFNMCEPM